MAVRRKVWKSLLAVAAFAQSGRGRKLVQRLIESPDDRTLVRRLREQPGGAKLVKLAVKATDASRLSSPHGVAGPAA